MIEDIHSHGIILINRYNEFFVTELKNIFGDDSTAIDYASLHSTAGMSSDLADLASQFIRALAAEASRQCLANQSGGALLTLSRPAQQSRSPGDLESPIIEDWAGRVAGATYLEENLRIPRSTLHRWHRCHEVIALRKGRQRHVFPLAQFVDGRPASGIREILGHIPNPRQAWFWLLHPSPHLNGRTPIDLLKQDVVSNVVSAAKEYAQTLSSETLQEQQR